MCVHASLLVTGLLLGMTDPDAQEPFRQQPPIRTLPCAMQARASLPVTDLLLGMTDPDA
jgi:hypothetical protein